MAFALATVLCASGCSTIPKLSPDAEKIEYVDSAPGCKLIKEASVPNKWSHSKSERQKILYRNEASKYEGASHVVIKNDDTYAVAIQIFQCDSLFNESIESVTNKCFDDNRLDACVSLDYKLQSKNPSVEKRLELYGKACSLKSDDYCKKRIGLQQQVEYVRLSNTCTSGEKESCEKLMKMHYSKNDTSGSIFWGKYGCLYGSDMACKMSAMLISEVGQVESNRLKMQSIELQKQANREVTYQNMWLGLQALQTNRVPTSTHCTTQRIGNIATTSCY